jgi:hypothetical protein
LLPRDLAPFLLFGPLGEPFTGIRDAEHNPLVLGITHLVGDRTRFCDAAAPEIGCVECGSVA